MEQVRIECEGAQTLSIEEMEPFQEDIKYLHKEDYESLRGVILSEGFSEPIGIWKHEGNNFIISGHQRHNTLKKMQDEGIQIPPVPVSLITCKDKKEAKKKVLELASVYGRFQKHKLAQYLKENGLELEDLQVDLRLPNIDLTEIIETTLSFEDDPFDLSDITGEAETVGEMKTHSSHVKMLQLFFNDVSHQKVLNYCNALSEHYGTKNVTDTIEKCVKECYERNISQ